MQIAIIADDRKKELIAQFCIAYCGILSKHSICATGITGKQISDATGLNIDLLLELHALQDRQSNFLIIVFEVTQKLENACSLLL